MKILVVSQYYYPEQFRITDICEALVSRGHNVTVVTGLPNYPEGEIYKGYEKAYERTENHNGVNIYRCNLRPRLKGAKNLALNYLSFVIEAKKVLKTIECDFEVIYVYGLSPISLALPAIWYKKKNHIPIYYYCMDIWPESVRDAQNGHAVMSKSNPIFIVAKILSKYIYKNMDVIGAKCEGFISYLNRECNVSVDKMHLLYEHAEDIYLNVSERPVDNGIIDFIFLGNMGAAQQCNLYIKAAKELEPKDGFCIHFVGDGSETDCLKDLVKELQVENNVVFHGRHPLSEIIKYYNLADCCLLSLASETETGVTPPGKLYGYMAASRPVIAAINGDSKNIISRANCGLCVDSDDYDGLLHNMQKVIDGNYDYKLAGTNGRRFFLNNFTLDKHISELENQLENTILRLS